MALNQFSRRYIFHLLARMTAYVDVGAGRADPFPALVDRNRKNPFDIEHIWAQNYALHQGVFESPQDFAQHRDTLPALLLLPADVNRSLQDKPYTYKVQKYATQHLYPASLATAAYEHQPQFESFRKTHGLPFRAHATFGKPDWAERQELVAKLVDLIWSPSRVTSCLD